MNILRKSFAVVLAVCILVLTGCSSVSLKSSDKELTPVATIGGYDVPYELYRYVVMNYKTQFEDGDSSDIWLGESGEALLDELNKNVEYSLIKMYTTLSLAEQYGLTVDNPLITSGVEANMKELYESFDNDMQAYKDMITEHHMTDSVYRFLVQNEMLTEELFYLLQNEGVIENDREALKELFHSDSFICVKHILISSTNGLSDEENLARIEDIYNQLENGADFETMLGMYGQDLYLFNNDAGYYITKGSRYVEFEEAAFALDVGEYSGIVKSPAGYSIIMRYEKDDLYMGSHFDELCQEYYDGAYNLLLEEHEKTLTMNILPAMENYSIFTME